MALCAALCALPAAAQDAMFTYSRSAVRIQPAPEPAQAPPSLPWALPWAASPGPATIAIDADIWSAASFKTQGWFSLSGIQEGRGILILYPQIEPALIPAATVYAPLDVLAIGEEGDIQRIVPNLVPAKLTEDLALDVASLAVLYLPGGTAQALGVLPGGKVLHKAFKAKGPVILTPENTPPPAPPKASPPPHAVRAPAEQPRSQPADERKIEKIFNRQPVTVIPPKKMNDAR